MIKFVKNYLPIVIIVAGVIAIGVIIYVNVDFGDTSNPQTVTAQEAAENAIDFINDNILQGQATASLIETLEESGLYKMRFSIEGQEIEAYITTDGKLLFPEAIDLSEVGGEAAAAELTIGNFSVSTDEICRENEKPIVYFFGSDGCPFCSWEHPIIQEVAGKFGNYISFHDNMNGQDDMDIFQRYSTGGVPTLVLGCKYYRVGAGQTGEEEAETEYLTAIICKLTDNQPGGVCAEVKDLVDQITN